MTGVVATPQSFNTVHSKRRSIRIYGDLHLSFFLCIVIIHSFSSADTVRRNKDLHTHIYRESFHIILFSRHSCRCKMLICHAAAGGFPPLPGGCSKNYLIKNLLLLHNKRIFSWAFCRMLSCICLFQSYSRHSFGICFKDDVDNFILSTILYCCGVCRAFTTPKKC